MTEDLPLYVECENCGWANLEDEHYCGYCAEEWCTDPDTCLQCNYPEITVY